MAQGGAAFATPVAFRDDRGIDRQLFMAAIEESQGLVTLGLFTSSAGGTGLSVKPVHLKDLMREDLDEDGAMTTP
ncbi:uncharacterized protein ARMOST_10179 [Armillaria ostoyae]|uniref:Uncharacterized protein n=1 Tax=Armillaria ostoyae TaxID=47428 RepID=A0A284RDK3_ARMOS|nr:uncharacterized protein ARMOST_10179 [Armillaria ostoyae]